MMKLKLLAACVLLLMSQLSAQQLSPVYGDDFENGISQWVTPDGYVTVTTQPVHAGKQSLQLSSGARVMRKISIKPGHSYQLSVWLKTYSGSDEIQVNTHGL